MVDTPPLWRLMTGSALRRYREGMGYALDDAAKILDCCASKISRVETGQRGIRPRELRELMDEYGVPAHEQETLLKLARTQHAGRGPAEVAPGPPDHAIWQAASEILSYDALRVPDLLQTSSYAEALGGASALRGPSRMTAIIGEGALRQMVGSATVMRAQLAALAASEATVQVLPFSSGALAAACDTGSLAILRFADAPALDVARIGSAASGHYVLGDSGLAEYLELFGELQASALSPRASATMLRAMARALTPVAVTR
jgi:transcriptional regulator with XRE-family HTH domain